MSLSELERLQIHGPISVRPVTGKAPYDSVRYLIIGPTGAGKSSFIEALAGESHGLNISGDQLASVTQKVTGYELINVRRDGLPVYIIDTPGFSDSNISEGEILGMVETWMEDNDGSIDVILFLIPINVTRVAGTKRRTIKMLKELLGGDLYGLVFVATMWDQLATESAQRRAESNFKQLENDILKEHIDRGATLTTFNNNQLSALEAFDKKYVWTYAFHFHLHLLYLDLHDRISTTLQEKQMLEEQMTNPTNDDILTAILEHNLAENDDLLVKFISQLREYEQPPDGYEDAHAQLMIAISGLGDDYQQRIENMFQEKMQVDRECRERWEREHQQRRDQRWREREQRIALENRLSFRVRRKVERVTESISDIFKRAS